MPDEPSKKQHLEKVSKIFDTFWGRKDKNKMDLYEMHAHARQQIATANDIERYADRALMWETAAKDSFLNAEEREFALKMVADMRLAISVLTKLQNTQALNAVVEATRKPKEVEEPKP